MSLNSGHFYPDPTDDPRGTHDCEAGDHPTGTPDVGEVVSCPACGIFVCESCRSDEFEPHNHA